MTQAQRRIFLISELLKEDPRYSGVEIPADEMDQKQLLRALMNVRLPASVSPEFLTVQDAYLQGELAAKKTIRLSDLRPVQKELYLWRGDITTLECGAIVNAANSGMTGCYRPCHNCIDNCIHTYAGVQLRLRCAELMTRQGFEEPVGQAKITPAYKPSLWLCDSHGRPCGSGRIDPAALRAFEILLPFLPGTGGRKRHKQYRALLYFHRRISVS